MKETDFTIQEIRELMDAFSRSKLGAMKLKSGGFTLELESGCAAPAAVPAKASPVPVEGPPVAEEAPQIPGVPVNSPIVGTFYEAPAPDKAPYVRVGSQVKKGDVLFIIESMKLMNEVTSDLDGTVASIAVENGQGVEYGQPILYIE